ncbi:hypothetical protein PC128_g4022 [Phytophthora cactorum]|nr:hypothetical protein PI125_g3820 [Phytophthora idaei]KAG3201272.1 hypothetical protein PC128_g4022 [Phytophthora cactorum]KAG4061907.1 hypothetical protein PC123_g3219 [Phytophthora cactorum]
MILPSSSGASHLFWPSGCSMQAPGSGAVTTSGKAVTHHATFVQTPLSGADSAANSSSPKAAAAAS